MWTWLTTGEMVKLDEDDEPKAREPTVHRRARAGNITARQIEELRKSRELIMQRQVARAK